MNFHDTSACCCHVTWPQPILGRACSELQASKLTLSLISDPADTLRHDSLVVAMGYGLRFITWSPSLSSKKSPGDTLAQLLSTLTSRHR